MKRNLLVMFVFILGAVSAYFWLLNQPAESALESNDIGVEGEVQRNKAERSARIPQAVPIKDKSEATSQVVVPKFRFESPQDLRDSNSLTIEVVNADGQAPGPACVLHVLALSRVSDGKAQRAIQSNLIGFLAEKGLHYQVPESGHLRIPSPEERLLLGAQSSFGFAHAMVRVDSDGPIKLKLEPLTQLRARVLDVNGVPMAGAHVALGVRLDSSAGSNRVREIFLSETGKDGIAHLEAIPSTVQQMTTEGQPYVGLQCVADPPVAVDLDFKNLPTEIIDLHVPPMGSLRVTVRDTSGKILKNTLGLVVDIDNGSKKSESRRPRGGVLTKVFENGVVDVPFVTCGLKLNVRIEGVIGPKFAPLTKTIHGPANPGEAIEVDFQVEDEFPVMKGRLLDPGGKPLTKKNVYVAWKTQVGRRPKMRGFNLKTDSEGRYTVTLQDKFDEDADARYLTFHVKKSRTQESLIAKHDLPWAAYSIHSQTLPDITLQPNPLLVSGVVFDSSGDLVKGARVRLISASKNRIERRKFKTEFVGQVETSESGEFSISGVATAEEFLVSVKADNLIHGTVAANKGDKGVRLTLDKAGFIHGTLELSDKIPLRSVVVSIDPEGKGGSDRIRMTTDSSFMSDALKPGRYKVLVLSKTAGQAYIFDSDPIEVAPGQTVDMGTIKIPFEAVPVKVVMEIPKFAPETVQGLMQARHPSTGKILAQYFVTKRTKEILLPVDGCDLVVRMRGYREEVLRGVHTGTLNVRLSRGYPVKFAVKNLEVLPEGVVIVYVLRGEGGLVRSILPGRGQVKKDIHYLTVKGDYSVTGFLVDKNSQSDHSLDFGKFELLGTDETQVVDLQLNADDVSKALKELSQ